MDEQTAEDLSLSVNIHPDWFAYAVHIMGSPHVEEIGTWQVIAQPSHGDYLYLTSESEWIVLREKWDQGHGRALVGLEDQ